jgi:hypothetical protein
VRSGSDFGSGIVEVFEWVFDLKENGGVIGVMLLDSDAAAELREDACGRDVRK